MYGFETQSALARTLYTYCIRVQCRQFQYMSNLIYGHRDDQSQRQKGSLVKRKCHQAMRNYTPLRCVAVWKYRQIYTTHVLRMHYMPSLSVACMVRIKCAHNLTVGSLVKVNYALIRD